MSGVRPAANDKKGRKSIRLRHTPTGGLSIPVPDATRRRLLRNDLLLRVKIETPAGDPARLSEAQQRRSFDKLRTLAALTRGEISQAEFLARENPGPG